MRVETHVLRPAHPSGGFQSMSRGGPTAVVHSRLRCSLCGASAVLTPHSTAHTSYNLHLGQGEG